MQRYPAPRVRLTPDADAAKLLEQADAVIAGSESSLPRSVLNVLHESFVNVPSHSGITVYVRKTAGLASVDAGT